jgi:hypothetical protein
MGPYAEHADRLLERGYAPLPIMPGSKRPGYYVAGMWIGLANWQRRFNSGPPSDTERRRWGANGAGLGVLGGYRGLVAIDLDTEDPALVNAILAVVPPSAIRKRGARGETRFFHGPGIKSQSFDIDGRRVVDLIAAGRQTVLPPSIHPGTGKPYQWTGVESLEDLEPEDLPKLPVDIAERISAALEPFGWRPEPAPRSSANGDAETPFRGLNETALAQLDAWVPALNLCRCRQARGGYEAVPAWRPSTTGRPIDKRHLNLKISPRGIRDFGADQGYTPLDLVMAADGCDLDTAFKFLAERLGWNNGADVSGLAPAPESTSNAKSKTRIEAETASPAEAVAPESDNDLERYTVVPGLLGKTTEWITATARRPDRVMALGAAISVVGTLIGRRVAGPTRSATHLNIVPLAPSGTGKQHPMNAARLLMRAAKAESHITGPTRFFSLSAIERHLVAQPLSLCLLDEIGAFLANVTSGRASSHEAGISQILRTLWGASFATIETTHRATEAGRIVRCPALSIFGTSTPAEFHAALQGENVANGFLNRFLVLSCGGRVADTDPVLDPATVPSSLAEALAELYVWSGPESLLSIGDPVADYAPDILPWSSAGARECYREFGYAVEQHTEADPHMADFMARCAETAIRLATIRAASRWGHGARIDVCDMEWGAGIAWTATQALGANLREFMPENERSRIAGRIADFIRRKGPVKVRNIQQFLKGRIRSPEIRDMLAQLVEAGEVENTPEGYKSAG